MLRRSLRFLWSAASPELDRVEDLINVGDSRSALLQLDDLKALKQPIRKVDYLRAVVFLKQQDVLQARQALLEELRWFPQENDDAQELLLRVESKLENYFKLPAPIVKEHPLFALTYDSIKSHTMLHWPRLLSLYLRAKSVCEHNVPGDLVECGVAGGGSSVILGTAIKHFCKGNVGNGYGGPRKLYSCDTFTGMPPPDVGDDVRVEDGASAQATHWGAGTCSSPVSRLEELRSNFSLESIIDIRPGLFQDTLHKLPEPKKYAMLHLDADWHESTSVALNQLYPHLSEFGVVQLDDFHYWGGCKVAFEEYFEEKPLSQKPQLEEVDGNAVVWVKGGHSSR